MKPRRVEILRLLSEPRTCTELGANLGDSPQKVYYHVKRLQKAGLVDLVQERRVRGITEGIYRATAHTYWLSPEIVGRMQHNTNRSVIATGLVVDLRPLRSCQRDSG